MKLELILCKEASEALKIYMERGSLPMKHLL